MGIHMGTHRNCCLYVVHEFWLQITILISISMCEDDFSATLFMHIAFTPPAPVWGAWRWIYSFNTFKREAIVLVVIHKKQAIIRLFAFVWKTLLEDTQNRSYGKSIQRDKNQFVTFVFIRFLWNESQVQIHVHVLFISTFLFIPLSPSSGHPTTSRWDTWLRKLLKWVIKITVNCHNVSWGLFRSIV